MVEGRSRLHFETSLCPSYKRSWSLLASRCCLLLNGSDRSGHESRAVEMLLAEKTILQRLCKSGLFVHLIQVVRVFTYFNCNCIASGSFSTRWLERSLISYTGWRCLTGTGTIHSHSHASLHVLTLRSTFLRFLALSCYNNSLDLNRGDTMKMSIRCVCVVCIVGQAESRRHKDRVLYCTRPQCNSNRSFCARSRLRD